MKKFYWIHVDFPQRSFAKHQNAQCQITSFFFFFFFIFFHKQLNILLLREMTENGCFIKNNTLYFSKWFPVDFRQRSFAKHRNAQR